MATLLLELFSEEIPSRMQRGAAEQLQRLLSAGFEKAEFKPSGIKTFVSPRHLAIELAGLPDMQKDVSEERKGPKVGAPEQAMKGFLTAVGLKVEQCEQRDGYYFAMIHRKGRPTADVAKEIIEAALSAFVWPKSMRWGANTHSWVRPLHRITCLLDKKVIPVQFAGITASNITGGHRFLHSGDVTITDAAQYAETLKKAHVIVDFAARRELVKSGVGQLAKQNNLTLVQDEALLDEVTGLVEWPVPLFGTFDKKFLELPKEVPISEMKVHQRYFALQDEKGVLSNHFIAVANMLTSDGGKKISEGNARVLRARLSDGAFYWEQDRKKPLSDWAKGLADIVFHAKVGMVSDKVTRIEKLALAIAKEVKFTDTKSVSRAAQLCKADLTTGMVGEFPELQGIMGRYYALAQKEDAKVADAIRDHYKPLGAADSLPESELAAIIAIADKLDSITSLFAAGEKPTGSKDPFALRRAALGILRIMLDRKIDLSIIDILSSVSAIYDPIRASKLRGVDPISKLRSADHEIIVFFRERLKQTLRDEGIRHDIVEAVLDIERQDFNPLMITRTAKELAKWMESADGTAALAAIKRSLNILAAEEKKGAIDYTLAKQSAQSNEEAEKNFRDALGIITTPSLKDLEGMTPLVNHFFDKVLVNAPDFRLSRLATLERFRSLANQIADFSKIEG